MSAAAELGVLVDLPIVDLRLDADGEISMIVGSRELVEAWRAQAHRLMEARHQRELIDRLWSEGLSAWIDRWTPFYIEAGALLHGSEEKLAEALQILGETPRVARA